MNILIAALAVLVYVPAFASARAIESEIEYEDSYRDDCNNYNLTLHPSDRTIQKDFVSSPTVKCLVLQGNSLEYVDSGAFDLVPNLTHLNLRGNKIRGRNLFSYGNLSSVTTLLLSFQARTSYDREVYVQGVYPQLQYLDLRSTGVSSFINMYNNPFPQLRYLDLSENSIIYTDFTNLFSDSLTHLVLNKNSISRFSAKKLTNLTELYLDENNINSIGDSYYALQLTNLANLRILSVVKNNISKIYSNAFNSTVLLQRLNLSFNALSQLNSIDIVNLQQLEVLALDGNLFEDIPINDMMNLTTLSMSCNKIKRLTVSPLLNLPYLRTLYLGGNMISDLNTFAFRFQTRLQELYLNDNRLIYLPEGWGYYVNSLKRLDLSGNSFTLLDSVVKSIPTSLVYVYFERNPLQYINTANMKSTSLNVTIIMQAEPGRVVPCRARSADEIVSLAGDDKKALEQRDATKQESSEVQFDGTEQEAVKVLLDETMKSKISSVAANVE